MKVDGRVRRTILDTDTVLIDDPFPAALASLATAEAPLLERFKHSARLRRRPHPRSGRAPRTDPSPEELIFLTQAWKAAFAKAQSLGWLY
jgi:hypothetical protein